MTTYRILEEDILQILSIYDHHLDNLSTGYQNMIEQLEDILLKTQSQRLYELIDTFSNLFNEEIVENLLRKNIEYWADTEASVVNYLRSIEAGDEIIEKAEQLEVELRERINTIKIQHDFPPINGQLKIDNSVFERSIEVVNKYCHDIELSLNESKNTLDRYIEENIFYLHIKPLITQLFLVSKNYKEALNDNIKIFQEIYIDNTKQLTVALSHLNPKIDISVSSEQPVDNQDSEKQSTVNRDENANYSNKNSNEQGSQSSEMNGQFDQTLNAEQGTEGKVNGDFQNLGTSTNELSDSGSKDMKQTNGTVEVDLSDNKGVEINNESSDKMNPEIEIGNVSFSNMNQSPVSNPEKERKEKLIDDPASINYEDELQRYRHSIDELFERVSPQAIDKMVDNSPAEYDLKPKQETNESEESYDLENYLMRLLEDLNQKQEPEKNLHTNESEGYVPLNSDVDRQLKSDIIQDENDTRNLKLNDKEDEKKQPRPQADNLTSNVSDGELNNLEQGITNSGNDFLSNTIRILDTFSFLLKLLKEYKKYIFPLIIIITIVFYILDLNF